MKKSQRQKQLELFNFTPAPPPSSPELPPQPSVQPAPPPKAQEPTPERQPRLPAGPDPELTRLARQLLEGLKMPELAAKVKVVWNSRLRTTAGRAFCKTQTVELNPALVIISPEEVDRTFRHELAHLLAYARAGKRRIEPHGPEWRKACADLGIRGEERCHDLPFERRRQQRKFAYRCPSCGRELHRVKRIRKSAACFQCCRDYNRGRYDSRFQLVEIRLSPGQE